MWRATAASPAPGASVELELGWSFPVPEHGSDRMGRRGQLYEIGRNACGLMSGLYASSGSVNQWGARCGVMISWIARQPIHPAAAKINTATASAASGSALPWP